MLICFLVCRSTVVLCTFRSLVIMCQMMVYMMNETSNAIRIIQFFYVLNLMCVIENSKNLPIVNTYGINIRRQ